MKIITTSTLLMTLLASIVAAAPSAPADRAFNASDPDSTGTNRTTHKIKTAANVKGSGAQIQLCPSGDCTGQAITLSMSRLEEVTPDLKPPAVQKADNFNGINGSWTAFELMTVGSAQAYVSSFVTTFKVGSATDDTSFNLTTMIYQATGTAMNGNQTIDVPAGSLKFSLTVTKWPFKSPDNKLQFGVILKTQGKKGGAPSGTPTKGAKKDKKSMDRLDLGESMFMDAPTLALVDNVTVPINSTIDTQGKTEMTWIFPSFNKSLYYDPVVGSEDPSASVTNDTSSTNGTTGTNGTSGAGGSAPTPAPTTAKPTSSASQIASVVGATVLAVVGACLM